MIVHDDRAGARAVSQARPAAGRERGGVRYFEDFPVGRSYDAGSLTVTRERMLEFAREYDPQAFHLDDAAAAASPFGRLAASGWQTASYAMRVLVDSGAFSGAGSVGLGVDELRWRKPVYADDTLHVAVACVEARERPGKPQGILTFAITTTNQHGEIVMTHRTTALVPKRDAGTD